MLAQLNHEHAAYVASCPMLMQTMPVLLQVLVDRLAAVDMVRPDAASKPAQRKEGTIKSGIYSGRTGSDEDSDFDD